MLKLFRQAFAAFWEKHFATDCTTSPQKRTAVQLLQSGAELLDAPNASEIDH